MADLFPFWSATTKQVLGTNDSTRQNVSPDTYGPRPVVYLSVSNDVRSALCCTRPTHTSWVDTIFETKGGLKTCFPHRPEWHARDGCQSLDKVLNLPQSGSPSYKKALGFMTRCQRFGISSFSMTPRNTLTPGFDGHGMVRTGTTICSLPICSNLIHAAEPGPENQGFRV